MRGGKRSLDEKCPKANRKKARQRKEKFSVQRGGQRKQYSNIDQMLAIFLQEQQFYGGNEFLCFDPQVQDLDMYSNQIGTDPKSRLIEYDSYSSPGSDSSSYYEEEEEEEENCSESFTMRSEFSLSSTSCTQSNNKKATVGEKVTFTHERKGVKRLEGFMKMMRTESTESGDMRKIQQGVKQMKIVSYNDRELQRLERSKLTDLRTGESITNLRGSLGKRRIEICKSNAGRSKQRCKQIQICPQSKIKVESNLMKNDRLVRGRKRLKLKSYSSSSSSESEEREKSAKISRKGLMQNDKIVRRGVTTKPTSKIIYQDENGNEIDPELMKSGKYIVDEEYEGNKRSSDSSTSDG